MTDINDIPRETLIALLKKKEKEIKSLTAGKTKSAEGYAKVKKYNKILLEDRKTFIKFATRYCPDAPALFESSAAQEQSMDYDVLVSHSASAKSTSSNSPSLDLLQGFVHMVFPHDPDIQAMFSADDGSNFNFETLRSKWMALEERSTQAVAVANQSARDGILQYQKMVDQRDGDIKRLNEHVKQLSLDNAAVLVQKLGGEAGGGRSPATAGVVAQPASVTSGSGGGARNVNSIELEAKVDNLASENADLIAKVAAVRSELESQRGYSSRAEARAKEELEQERARVVTLTGEVAANKERTRALVESKDEQLARLRETNATLQTGRDENAFIEQMAAKQAARDLDISRVQSQMENMQGGRGSYARRASQDNFEASSNADSAANDAYLKEVLLKYVRYVKEGDSKANTLVPVLSTCLQFSKEEENVFKLEDSEGGIMASAYNLFAVPMGSSAGIQQ